MKIELVGVEVKFAKAAAAALSEITFEVPAGQVCVLLGPSGSGKSTLLRCLNGLVMPTSGQVLLDGREVSKHTLQALRRRIGTVHQAFGLSSRLSVARNVLTGSLAEVSTLNAWLGIFTERQKRKAAALLTAAGLEEQHLARRASGLSGGQQQRVGIARALMADPSLILADEPVASLDPTSSSEIAALLVSEARRRGATLLCSLHQVDLARGMADRIIALSGGRIVFDGPPSRLRDADLAQIYGAPKEASVA